MTIPHHGPQDLLAMAGDMADRYPAAASASDAYLAAQYAVIRLTEADGAQIWERSVWLGTSVTRRYAEPLADVRTAQVRPETVARVGREHAERARGDGITWEQIGEALGLDQGPYGTSGYDLGIAAFEHFTAEAGHRYPASFHFGCASCGEYITDRGPFESHPEDNERGHAEGCVRMAADIVAWQAQQDAWEADGWPGHWGATGNGSAERDDPAGLRTSGIDGSAAEEGHLRWPDHHWR